MFSLAPFAFEAIEQGSEVADVMPKRENARLFFTQGAFQLLELAQHFAQLTLHGKWAFGALLASGDGDVVKAFAGLREEKCIGVLKRETPRDAGFRNDVAVAQLGKNDFQRFAEAIEYTDRMLERNDLCSRRRAVGRFVEYEGELGL